jgi:hypothetical protein
VSAFFGGCEKFPAICFTRVFELPLLLVTKRPKTRLKKKRAKQPGEKREKKEEKKAHFL